MHKQSQRQRQKDRRVCVQGNKESFRISTTERVIEVCPEAKAHTTPSSSEAQ